MDTKHKMAILLVTCASILVLPAAVYAASPSDVVMQGRIWSMGVAPMVIVVILAAGAAVLAVAVVVIALIARYNSKRICRNKLCAINPDCDVDRPYDFGSIETPDEINATRQLNAVGSDWSAQDDAPELAPAKTPIIDPVDIMLQQVIARVEQEALRAPVPLQLVPQMKHARKSQPITEARKVS